MNTYESLTALTVVVSTFNSQRYIHECLDSIVKQGSLNLELIVIDGGSSDGTISVVRNFMENHSFIKLFEFEYLSFPDALNLGIGKLASSKYVTFLNSDDYYIGNCIDKILDIFNTDATIDIVQCEGFYIDENGSYVKRYPSRALSVQSFLLTASSDVLQPAVFFKKELFQKVGGISSGIKCLVDLDLWSKMLLLNPKVYFVQDLYVAAYRLHSSSFTISGKDKFVDDLILYTDSFRIGEQELDREFLFFNYLRLMNYYRELRIRRLTIKYFLKASKLFRIKYLRNTTMLLRCFQILVLILFDRKWSK